MNEVQRNLVKQINYEREMDYRTSVEMDILDTHPEICTTEDLNVYLVEKGINPYLDVSPEEEDEIWDAIIRNIEHYKEYGTSIHIALYSDY